MTICWPVTAWRRCYINQQQLPAGPFTSTDCDSFLSYISLPAVRRITMHFRRTYVAANDKTHLVLHAECTTFLSDCNQIRTFSADFHKSPQYQISRKSFHLDPRWYMRTEVWTDTTTVIGAFRQYVKAKAPKESVKIIRTQEGG
jgi:hypothetical protein